mgnify:CR=1 FL=1
MARVEIGFLGSFLAAERLMDESEIGFAGFYFGGRIGLTYFP